MGSILDYCKDLPQKNFVPGEMVLEQGKTDNLLFILIQGEFEVSKNDISISLQTEPGAIFGELSVLLNIPHMATVKATTPSTAYVVENASEFLLSSYHDIAFYLAKILALRLKNATDYLVDIKSQFADQGGHLGMIDEVLESLAHHQEEECQPGSERHPDNTI